MILHKSLILLCVLALLIYPLAGCGAGGAGEGGTPAAGSASAASGDTGAAAGAGGAPASGGIGAGEGDIPAAGNASAAGGEAGAAAGAGGASAQEQFAEQALLEEITRIGAPDYRVYSSRLLDTYFIACALYFNFESQELLPNAADDVLYRQAASYFGPYRDHPFIQGLAGFVDVENRAQSHGVVYPLLMYAFSRVEYGMDVSMVQTDAFQNGEAFQSFLRGLYGFYRDTGAQAFFASVAGEDALASLPSQLAAWPLSSLLTGMESYVGNKETQYPGQTVKYRSVLTLYRPFNASFYTIGFGDDVCLAGQQSPVGASKKSGNIDIAQTVNTTVHEFLHAYLNQPVYEQNEQILRLAGDRDKAALAGPLYQGMEWHRIADENIVRAVETAIFRQALGDGERAFDLILKNEIAYGGMPRLRALYEALPAYEARRDTYKSIDAYLPELIHILFA